MAVIAATMGALFASTSIAAAGNERIDIDVKSAWVFQLLPYGEGEFGYSGYPATLSAPLEMSADLNADGTFTLPADQFRLDVTLGGPGGSTAFAFDAAADMPGTFDRATGQMSISIPARFLVSSLSGPGGAPISCAISGFTPGMKTSDTLNFGVMNFEGAPFSSGSGKLLGPWSEPIADLTVKGANGTSDEACEMTLGGGALTDFAGAFWMDAQAEVVDLTPPAPPVPPVTTKLALTPAKRTVKAGKSTLLRLRVENATETDRIVKVLVCSSNRKVTVRKKIYVELPARTAVLTPLKVKATKTAKGKAKITVKTEGLTSTSTITVKKLKVKVKKSKRKGR